MSTLVEHVDYVNRRIYLSEYTVNNDVDTLEIYKEVRAQRVLNDEHRSFKPMIIGGGNITKITGRTFTPAYVQLLHGCRLVPYDLSHLLRVTRDTFTDDGLAGRDCFDRSSLSAGIAVDIDIDFPEIEIRNQLSNNTLSDANFANFIQILNSKPTSTEIASAVWNHSFTAKLLTVAKFLGLK